MSNAAEAGGRSISSLLLSVLKNVEQIVQSEIRLAKAEISSEFDKAGQAGKLLGAGSILAILALAFLLLSCVYLLATIVAIWLAALIVALSAGVVAGLLITAGMKRMKLIHPAPQKTIASVKENIEWAKAQTR